MANRDGPNGFTPVRHNTGGEIRCEQVPLLATNAAIGIGDPLMLEAAGGYDAWTSGAIAGIAAEAKSASVGADQTILAYVDPEIIYTAQTDDGTGTLTALTGVNLNATALAGTPANGRSTAEIDETSGATGNATLPLKILGLAKTVGNVFGEFNRLEVLINNNDRKGGTGTVGK